MICTSVSGKSLGQIEKIIDKVEMAEIRLDLCDMGEEEIEVLFGSSDIPLVATCHDKDLKAAEAKLKKAIEAGAAFVDIDLNAPAPVSKRLSRLAYDKGTTIIRSYHDYTGTPSLEVLEDIYEKAKRFGADIVKIITTGSYGRDWAVLESLYKKLSTRGSEGDLIAFLMSPEGSESRIACLKWGAPFTYAALDGYAPTAPGQLFTSEMHQRIYGVRERFETSVNAACSKSFAQRAIICAALAEGVSHLRRYTPCEDSEAAIKVASEVLGAQITRESDGTLRIAGAGSQARKLSKIKVGESGLLARLMIPLAAQLDGTVSTVDGERTLTKRPLSGARDIMASFGVLLESDSAKEVHVPVRISGKLLPGKAEINGKGGSQLISGLLMALPLAEKNSELTVNDPRSIPYMFISLDVLRKFGIRIDNEMEGDENFLETRDWSYCSCINFSIKGGQRYTCADIEFEGDWSAAANTLTAGAIFGHARVQGLDSSSLQADLSIMDVLVEAGACVSEDEDGTIHAVKAPLRAFETDLNNAPDLFPIVSVLAAFCQGTSRISGIGRLRGKESDRARAIAEMLTQMGVKARTEGDTLVVEGETLSSRIANGRLLNGGEYTSHNDHRMVMALKVAALGAKKAVLIDDEDCIRKSIDSISRIL